MATTSADVASAAELERRRLANQAAKARASGQSQAQQARAETEAQAQAAIAQTESQYQAARTQVQREAETRQAEIRQSRGQVEREAEAAKAQARQARAIEQRKVVLPFTKPRNLGTVAYIASVEATRKEVQRSGADANAAVTRVRDNYFQEVDKARDKAVSAINKQKAGIIADIQTQLLDYNAEINKQVAQMNSGISVWRAQGEIAIKKAQSDYEKALRASLNRSGTDVFADMKDKGLIPDNAVYGSYDKTTGQLNYTVPDMRPGNEIFADLQASNQIAPNAIYEGYDAESGKVSYKIEVPNFGSSIFRNMQNAGTIPKDATFVKYDGKDKTVTYFMEGQGTVTVPEPTGSQASGSGTTTTGGSTTLAGSQNSTNVVGAAAGTAAMATMVITVGGTTAAVGGPPGWVIGGAIAAIGAAIAIYAERERIGAWIRAHLPGGSQPSNTSEDNQAADAVVTNNDGSVVYSIQQFTLSPSQKRQTVSPLPQEKPLDLRDYLPNIKPFEEKLILEQERVALPPTPITKEPPVVMIRDPFDVPELKQKTSNILIAADAVRAATKTIPMTREQWDRVEEALRQGRVAEGKRIIESLARKAATPTIARNLTEAYREYLRKKAILDAARKAYVASLNPQPIKGRGSNKAAAAAIGLWLAQDILRTEIAKSLAAGESLETAMAKAHTKVKEMSQELGLTQQQINAATATVVYQVALSEMAQQAVKAASQAQAQNLTATQTQTQTLTAAKSAAQVAVQSAVHTHTMTLAQAAELARELDRAAELTAETTTRIKLPKLPSLRTEGKGKKYPNGTIVWNQGETERGDEYKIILPPYTMRKPISSKYPPKGMTKTKGTPQQTLTFIGGKVPFNNVSFDLGVTDGFIDVKHRKIKFTGGGQRTNVGTRIESTTRGVALVHNPPLKTSRGNGRKRLVSHGVYADKHNTRITRKRRRGWKRIY